VNVGEKTSSKEAVEFKTDTTSSVVGGRGRKNRGRDKEAPEKMCI